MFLHRAKWQRQSQPVLSAMTTNQDWCRVTLYNPTVLRIGDRYRMWYLGNSSASRTNDMDLGLSESQDGIHWVECPRNPILRGTELPEDYRWQTPHVIHDADQELYRMWFVMSRSERDEKGGPVSFAQKLGYASSPDGLTWDIHPEPIFHSGRRPCVLKDGPDSCRMWMNSSPTPDGDFDDLVGSIYRFESTDGLHWIRDPKPVVTTSEKLRSVVYPFVLDLGGDYTMWYGCHVEGGAFEIFCSTSADGLAWERHHEEPAFAATRNPNDFDGRYTSTPCVVDDGDRYLLYYSARDCGNLYRGGDGTIKADGSGVYRHIGVAICPKDMLQ